MRHLVFAASAAVLAAATACGTPATDIADLAVVTTLPKEVGPGGFQQQLDPDGIATGFFYKAEIADCSAPVAAAGRAWAGEQGLSEGPATVEARRTTLHFTTARFPDAAFVVRYSLSTDGTEARVRITYEGGSGAAPSTQDLVGMGMQALIDGLLDAAQCAVPA